MPVLCRMRHRRSAGRVRIGHSRAAGCAAPSRRCGDLARFGTGHSAARIGAAPSGMPSRRSTARIAYSVAPRSLGSVSYKFDPAGRLTASGSSLKPGRRKRSAAVSAPHALDDIAHRRARVDSHDAGHRERTAAVAGGSATIDGQEAGCIGRSRRGQNFELQFPSGQVRGHSRATIGGIGD